MFNYPEQLEFYQVARTWHKERAEVEFMQIVHAMAAAFLKGLLRADWHEYITLDGETHPCSDERWSRAVQALQECAAPLTNFEEPVCEVEIIVLRPRTRRETKTFTLQQRLEPVLIHREDFRAWLIATGQPLPTFWYGNEPTLEPVEPSPAPNPPPPNLPTPEQIAAEGLRQYLPAEQIAAKILHSYPSIENRHLGELLPANPGSVIDHGSVIKRGQRLKKAVENHK